HHRALDLALDFRLVLEEAGKASQDQIQDASDLCGADHVHVKLVKAVRVLDHRLVELETALDVGRNLVKRLLEGDVFALGAQDVETADKWNTRIDHRSELAREDDK